MRPVNENIFLRLFILVNGKTIAGWENVNGKGSYIEFTQK